ncbi:MAG: hypothetical protein AAFY28_06135 [Actinomycetota bacterium]
MADTRDRKRDSADETAQAEAARAGAERAAADRAAAEQTATERVPGGDAAIDADREAGVTVDAGAHERFVEESPLDDTVTAEQLAGEIDPRGSDIGDARFETGSDMADDTIEAPAGTDPADFINDFDEAMAAGDAPGGLDGRNDSVASGGHATDPNAEAPTGGLEGAAGRYPDHINAVLEQQRDAALKAAADGNFEEADRIAGETQQFLIDSGLKDAPPEETPTEMITNFGSGTSDNKQVWDPEAGEVVEVSADTESESVPMGTVAEQLKQTGTAASGDGGEGTNAPSNSTGANKLTTEDDAGMDDHIRDPSRGWGDEHSEIRWETATGGAVDPPPEEVGSWTTDTIDADPDDMISQPVGPEDAAPYGEVPDEIDDDIDHEFTPVD